MTSIHQLWPAVFSVIVLLALTSSTAFADEAGEETDADQSSEALQDQVNAANNPLADLVSVSLHNYYLDAHAHTHSHSKGLGDGLKFLSFTQEPSGTG